MEKGFIMLSRKLFSHRIWKASRAFSECEAWIDLIQSARFEATVTIERIGGRDITYERGQYPASISFLSKRWGWESEKKVRNFLDMLKKEGMITTEAKQGMNVITLCKYDDYNTYENDQGKPKGKGDGVDIAKKISDLEYALGEVRASIGATVGQGKGNNKKKGKKEEEKDSKKESPNGDEKEGEPSSCAHPDYLKFQDWIKRKAPFCSNPKNFPVQITESEFFKLKAKYTGQEIADTIEQIENRKDLRKRYTNLYRTVLNWAKKEYGK